MKKIILFALAALTVSAGAFGVKANADKAHNTNACCVEKAACCAENAPCCE